MIAVDYFLYDNRTQAAWGRDWGIKAATGKLRNLAKLRAEFSRYCAALPSQMGTLSGFGDAAGGFRVSAGYLLCLTLETRDLAGRPSWAVFGLWCPDAITLSEVIAADPIASARAILGTDAPPNGLQLQRASKGVRPVRTRTSPKAVFRRFDPEESAGEVLSLLLGSVHAGTVPPNVLGITASARIPELAEAGFDRVYCHPMDDLAARSFARFLTESDTQIERESWRDERSIPPIEPAGSSWIVRPQQSTKTRWFLWLPTGVILAVCAILIAPSRGRGTPSEDLPQKVSPASSSPGTKTPSSEAILLDIGERLQELKRLPPDELRHTKGYKLAQEPVLEEWVPERKKVLDAYATLLALGERMTNNDRVAYYFDDAGKNTEPAKRLEKVMALLEPLPFDTHPCETLRYAFAFEFEDENSTLSRWCNSETRVERTVKLVRSR